MLVSTCELKDFSLWRKFELYKFQYIHTQDIRSTILCYVLMWQFCTLSLTSTLLVILLSAQSHYLIPSDLVIFPISHLRPRPTPAPLSLGLIPVPLILSSASLSHHASPSVTVLHPKLTSVRIVPSDLTSVMPSCIIILFHHTTSFTNAPSSHHTSP